MVDYFQIELSRIEDELKTATPLPSSYYVDVESSMKNLRVYGSDEELEDGWYYMETAGDNTIYFKCQKMVIHNDGAPALYRKYVDLAKGADRIEYVNYGENIRENKHPPLFYKNVIFPVVWVLNNQCVPSIDEYIEKADLTEEERLDLLMTYG